MDVKTRTEIMRKIFEGELVPLSEKKGKGYNLLNDSMANLKRAGWPGIVIRLGDKISRLESYVQQYNFLKMKEFIKDEYKEENIDLEDEKLEDTIKDVIIYGFLLLILFRMEMKKEILEPLH